MSKANLFDVVEILCPLPSLQLPAGTQGVLVEQYDEQTFEVEFMGNDGQMIGLYPLAEHQFVVIWQASLAT